MLYNETLCPTYSSATCSSGLGCQHYPQCARRLQSQSKPIPEGMWSNISGQNFQWLYARTHSHSEIINIYWQVKRCSHHWICLILFHHLMHAVNWLYIITMYWFGSYKFVINRVYAPNGIPNYGYLKWSSLEKLLHQYGWRVWRRDKRCNTSGF